MSATTLASPAMHGLVDQVGDDERFRVQGRMEIVGVLRSLAAHREIVTVQYGGSDDFVVSAILAVFPEVDQVVLDYGANEKSMQRLLASSRLRFSTQLDHVRVLFQVDAAAAVAFEGAPAVAVRLPASMLRLQRRDTYRLKVPLGRPLLCEVPVGEHMPKTTSLRVRDISVDGIGLADYGKDVRVAGGMVWPGCRIRLPDLGMLVCDIEVMHATEGDARRCGCRFRALPLAMSSLIQRYITRVEREQHATR
jgi:c-di-GMP-binding flagellar brake protein YcgR